MGDEEDMVLDHNLRFIESNIQPSHYLCNSKKGSKH